MELRLISPFRNPHPTNFFITLKKHACYLFGTTDSFPRKKAFSWQTRSPSFSPDFYIDSVFLLPIAHNLLPELLLPFLPFPLFPPSRFYFSLFTFRFFSRPSRLSRFSRLEPAVLVFPLKLMYYIQSFQILVARE